MVNSSCLNPGTEQALGSGFNSTKVMTNASTDTSDAEAQLYRYVMAKYQPNADPTGYSFIGYQGMLGLVRAVNAGGLTGAVTPASITAALKAAKNVPMPVGAGKLTFTCNGKSLPGLVSACSQSSLVLTVENGKGLDPVEVGN
jgi:branched-chain amino acid transport system substrate-binding protein